MPKKKWDLGNASLWKGKTAEHKAEQMKLVLRELDISTEKLEHVPKITDMLKHRSLGGIRQVVAAMRFSTDPLIEHFLERWDELPPEFQEIVPWEALAQ